MEKNYVQNNGIPWEERRTLMGRSIEEKFADTGELHAFYGSLRRGEYNSSREGTDYVFLETVTITGFKLYSLGPYPAVVKSTNKEDTIVVDLYKITNADRAASIYNMELGASYQLKKVIISQKEYTIYLFDEGWENNRPVPSGDWSKRQEAEAVS